jgi:hypothetical protein
MLFEGWRHSQAWPWLASGCCLRAISVAPVTHQPTLQDRQTFSILWQAPELQSILQAKTGLLCGDTLVESR